MRLLSAGIITLCGIGILGAHVSRAHADAASIFARQQSFAVDVSPLASVYAALPADEQDEQVRDWALYGLLEHLDLRGEETVSFTPNKTPIRAKDARIAPVAPGRVAMLGDNEGLVLVPRAAVNDVLLIGALVDGEKALFKTVPARMHVMGYTLASDSKTIDIAYDKTVTGKTLFSPAYGYHERPVRTIDDFTAFLSHADDVTTVIWSDGKLVLGGRRNKERAAGLSVEAIAALYQAYAGSADPRSDAARRQSYETFVKQAYDRTVKRDPALRKALAAGTVTRRDVLAEIRKKAPYTPADPADASVGFSLDPARDYAALAGDLEKLIKKDTQWVAPADAALSLVIDSHTAVLGALVGSLKRKQDIVPLLRLIRTYKASGEPAERHFAQVLQAMEIKNAYQCARYDGTLQGTIPGMILFYTDLTAKLWALDYNQLAPRGKIKGFKTIPEIKVPRLHWEAFLALSQTRLWFGLRQESFDIRGSELRFAPVATRVYAASSDPLKPGRESKPNYQSEAFLGWWDRHYAAVADFEPYYHQLNQLQKWSCIFTVLKEVKSPGLSFLAAVPVTRDRDFVDWYARAADIKCRTGLPFKDKKAYHKTTECLSLLGSRDYPLMGRNFFLSGGVSLASRKDILSKLRQEKRAPMPKQTAAKKGPPAAVRSAAPASASAARGTAPSRVSRQPVAAPPATVTLTWTKGPQDIMREYVDGLVRLQETKQPGYKDEGVLSSVPLAETVVRVTPGKAYLVKCKGLRNSWVQVTVNEAGKPPADAIQASGTEPDSDIFSARLIANRRAEKMIAQPNASAIFPASPPKGSVGDP